MFENVDIYTHIDTDDRGLLSYKLTTESKGLGELKINNACNCGFQ